MCEIVVVDPERTDNSAIHQLAGTLYQEQNDGLGILSVQVNRDSDGPDFTYDAYRNTTPHWTAFHNFLKRTEDRTWRYVLHGRAKTTGDVNRQNTHPLPVDCPQCEAQWVVHNGSVRNHQQNFASLQSAGHSFETEVDSEIIAHKVQELPDSIEDHDDDTYNIRGNLNYLVFTENGILVKLSRKYYVTDDFIVSCSTRRADSDAVTASYSEMDNGYEWLLLTASDDPDRDVSIERKERTTRATTGNRYGSGSKGGSTASGVSSRQGSSVAGSGYQTALSRTTYFNESQDTVTEIYDDLAPAISEISAYKVAPGVIKVVDLETRNNETQFIFRDEEPKLYYYYARDEHDQLMDLFDQDGNLVPADELAGLAALFEEDPDAQVAAAATDATQTTLDAQVEVVEEAVEDDNPLGPNANPAEIALMELTKVYDSSKQAEREIRRLSGDEIESLARNAVHVPKAN